MTTVGVSESEDSLGAVLTLLGMGIKSVPQSVLRLKFSECSKIFMDLLGRFAESDNQVIVRSVSTLTKLNINWSPIPVLGLTL